MVARSFIVLLAISLASTTASRADSDERVRALVRIEKDKASLDREMTEKVGDLSARQQQLQSRIAQREKTLQANSRKGFYTKPSQEALKKLRAELQQVDAQIGEKQAPFQARRDALEQQRRAVIRRYPELPDPIYVEHEGRLLTKDEWELAKSRAEGESILAKSLDPGAVAEEYIQDLLRRGVIRSAKYVNTTRHAESGERGLGARVVDFQNVNYTVQYVSKGGVLNERTAWVTLLTGDGTHWIVSRLMKETEVLGGLP